MQAGRGTAFAWIHGDGSRPMVNLRLMDNGAEVWQFQAFHTAVFWHGWRCIFWDVWPERSTPQHADWWAGDADEQMQPPLTFRGLVIDDCGALNYVDPIPPSEQTGEIGLGPVYYVPWQQGR